MTRRFPIIDWEMISHRFLLLRACRRLRYFGRQILKTPQDMWVYQEIIHKVRPALLVEFGTNAGGSALWFAHQMDLIGKGEIVSVDISPKPNLPQHPRLTYLQGDSLSQQVQDAIKRRVGQAAGPVMFSEDSKHTFKHVTAELNAYSQFVTFGSYFVVEDTCSHGPLVAVTRFLAVTTEFVADREREKFQITANPGGWLKRVRGRSDAGKP